MARAPRIQRARSPRSGFCVCASTRRNDLSVYDDPPPRGFRDVHSVDKLQAGVHFVDGSACAHVRQGEDDSHRECAVQLGVRAQRALSCDQSQ
jgi:hypothetical protein